MEESVTSERDAVIVGACRTAIGKFLSSLSTIPAPQLGAVVIREALRRGLAALCLGGGDEAVTHAVELE